MQQVKGYSSRIEFINTVLENKKVDSILDIGGGGMSPNIPNEFRPMSKYIYNKTKEAQYLAVEIDKDKASRMQDTFLIKDVLCDDIVTNTTIDSNSYQYIYCGLVLQYIDELDRALNNLHRILRKKGMLIFDVPNTMYYRNILRYIIKGSSLLDTDNFHQTNFSIPVIDKILKKNRFKIVEVSFVKGLNENIFIPKNMYEFIGIKAVLDDS